MVTALIASIRRSSHTHLPQVPREKLRSIVERDSLTLLDLKS